MAGPACVACGSDARPSSRVAYERILSPYSISAEPPPLRPAIGQRHGVSSRNGRHWPKLRQHFPPARGRPSGMGLDVDRLPGAGPALCGADAAQVTGFHSSGGPRARDRHRNERHGFRPLRHDGSEASPDPRSWHDSAVSQEIVEGLRDPGGVSCRGFLWRALDEVVGRYGDKRRRTDVRKRCKSDRRPLRNSEFFHRAGRWGSARPILYFHRRSSKGSATLVAYPAVAFYGEHSTKLSAVMATSGGGLTFENDASPIGVRFVTANFFTELGAGAALGRVLNLVWDDGVGGNPAVVLDYRFWQRRFASDPSVIGRTIRLNRMPATVVGVASEKFTGLDSGRAAIWVPMARQPYFVAGSPLLTGFGFGHGVAMFGRLRQGVTSKMAEEELRAMTAVLRRQHPEDFWEDERLPGAYASQLEPDGYAGLALAATLMLLILAVACGNLGGLLLARGVAREREIAIRAALGAGHARIVRQLFTESLLLSLI